MIIEDLDLQRVRKQGQYEKLYYQKSMKVSSSIGNSSNAVRILTAKNSVQFTNGTLYQSLDSEDNIKNDIAYWEPVATSDLDTFALSGSVFFLKVINDGNGESIFNVTGV